MVKVCRCRRCNHEWASRVDMPRMCPNCQSKKWDSDDANSVIIQHTHTCQQCKHEWKGKELPIACPRCQSKKWKEEKQEIYEHTCPGCWSGWNSRVERPLKCPRCQIALRSNPKKMEDIPYRYADGHRVGIRCGCGEWYPLREDKKYQKCPNGHGNGGAMEIEKEVMKDGEL